MSPIKLTDKVKSQGCAAKISASELKTIVASLPKNSVDNLITGIDNFDDACVYKISDEIAIVQTIDFFPPMVDDPFTFGRIAATNALSDIYAMGARPLFALSVLCFPTCDFPLEVASEILRGSASQVAAAGATIAGGHSIASTELIYGLSVTGVVNPNTVLTNSGAKVRDHLILTKAIGTGVCLLGLKGDELSEGAKRKLLANLTELNSLACKSAIEIGVLSATDVTGFGLIGHLHEMAKASGLSFKLSSSKVPILPEALALASQGFVPAGAYNNRQSFENYLIIKQELGPAHLDLFFDPQTAGGLLLAVSPKESEALLKKLHGQNMNAARIGEFVSGEPGIIEVWD